MSVGGCVAGIHPGVSHFLQVRSSSKKLSLHVGEGHQVNRTLYGEKVMELPERTNEAAGVYANRCIELAKEMKIPFIDLWSKMQATEGWQKKFLSDGLHLTAEGNAIVHKEVVRVFSDAHLLAEEMPYDFPHHSEIDAKHVDEAFK